MMASVEIRTGKDRIAVEAFQSFEAAAEWTDRVLLTILNPYPGWDTLVPQRHADPREVFSLLTTIDETARFLVRMEYPYAEVIAVLRRDFPDGDAEAAYNTANEVVQRDQAAVDKQIAAENRAAVAAEHDLGRSMHP